MVSFPQKRAEVFIEPFSSYDEYGFMRAKISYQSPWKVRVVEGKKFYDILRLADPINFALSKRSLKIIESEGFSGFRALPIDIQGENKEYYAIQTYGRCGATRKPLKRGFVIGFKFDFDTWDNSDFFCPEDSSFLFCTERVVKAFRKNKVTNIEFTDIEEAEWYCPERFIDKG